MAYSRVVRRAPSGGSLALLLLPPLESLRFFEAAARHQGFARAAEELAITPAAVAHRVRMLEKHLDVPLFDRCQRGGAPQPPRLGLPEGGAAHPRRGPRRLRAPAPLAAAGPQHPLGFLAHMLGGASSTILYV